LILFNVRIAGITDIVGVLLRSLAGDVAWRIAFVLELLMSPLLCRRISSLPKLRIDASYPLINRFRI
jgi:hypothetical protein